MTTCDEDLPARARCDACQQWIEADTDPYTCVDGVTVCAPCQQRWRARLSARSPYADTQDS